MLLLDALIHLSAGPALGPEREIAQTHSRSRWQEGFGGTVHNCFPYKKMEGVGPSGIHRVRVVV